MNFSPDSSKVLILSHFLLNPIENSSAASTAIRDHLLKKTKRIVQIEMPFTESKEKHFYILDFIGGKQNSTKILKIIKNPMWIVYLAHPLIVFYKVLKTFTKYDIAIACENLSLIAILPLKKLGLIKKLVYYSVDYVPQRFENKYINSIYHLLDRLACYNSDVNWVVSKEQIIGRYKNGVTKSKASPFEVVPIGYRLSEIKILPVKKINYYNLIFAGSIRPTAGPQLIVEALPNIIRKFPKTKVTFAGGGDYAKDLKIMAKKLRVLKHLEFLGYIDKHQDMLNVITNKSIGLAPYVWDPKSISMTSDPAKIKIYLCCGVPVITTKVATSWPKIAKSKSGMIIDYNKDQMSAAVINILKSKKKYMEYKNNTIKLSKNYDVDRILKNALIHV